MQPEIRQPPGRRERGKLDKRRRIREATREIFRREGYENATTREIAELADVAIGTLFAYAADKRELLMLVVNDDREALPDVQMNSGTQKYETLDVLVSFFEPRYRYWAREPELSRFAVQETLNYNLNKKPGPELARFYEGRVALLRNLSTFFKGEQKSGRVSASQSAETIAWLFMAIYQAEVRDWLSAAVPKAATGLKRLRKLFVLALDGVTAKAAL